MQHTGNIPLTQTGSIGQTFTAAYAGLQGITIYLSPDQPGEGEIRLSLYDKPDTPNQEIARAALPLEDITQPGFYRFRFQALPGSQHHDYFLQLQVQGKASLLAGSGPGDSYLDGAAYLNDVPLDSQLTFRLNYRSQEVSSGLVRELFTWVGMLAAAVVLFLLPGWGLLALSLPDWHQQPFSSKLALAGGLSAAIYPLLFLWTSILGMRLGSIYAFLPPIAGVLALFWRGGIQRNLSRNAKLVIRITPPPRIQSGFPELAFILVAGLIIFSRFWAIRLLDVPLYGDSYQHSLITRLILDHSGLFNSWLPYSELTTFTYHFGFHSLAAVFAWMTGLSVPQAVLYTGQILNVLAILALVPLARKLSLSAWSPVITILVAGLLSPMPAEYTNWGRYTQLAGQVVLPILAWFLFQTFEQKGFNARQLALTCVLLAGTALFHYRVLIFAAIFILAYTLIKLPTLIWKQHFQKIIILGIGSVVLFSPWLIHVYAGKTLDILGNQLSTPASQVGTLAMQTNSIGNLLTYLPAWLWLVLPLLAAYGIWQKNKCVIVISVWWLLNFLAANPQWLNLPGAGAITNFAVLIAAYIPAGILAGAMIGSLFPADITVEKQPPLQRPMLIRGAISTISLVVVLVAAILGARARVQDIQPARFALITRADLRAAHWIQSHLPLNSLFMVNAFPAYGDYTVAGSDAGWWLPLLAERATTLPPANYGFEEGPRPDYRQWVNALVQDAHALGMDSPDLINRLQERGVTHIYLGQRQGSVNAPIDYALDAQILLNSPYYRLVYHQDRVWVFEVIYLQ